MLNKVYIILSLVCFGSILAPPVTVPRILPPDVVKPISGSPQSNSSSPSTDESKVPVMKITKLRNSKTIFCSIVGQDSFPLLQISRISAPCTSSFRIIEGIFCAEITLEKNSENAEDYSLSCKFSFCPTTDNLDQPGHVLKAGKLDQPDHAVKAQLDHAVKARKLAARIGVLSKYWDNNDNSTCRQSGVIERDKINIDFSTFIMSDPNITLSPQGKKSIAEQFHHQMGLINKSMRASRVLIKVSTLARALFGSKSSQSIKPSPYADSPALRSIFHTTTLTHQVPAVAGSPNAYREEDNGPPGEDDGPEEEELDSSDTPVALQLQPKSPGPSIERPSHPAFSS